MRGGRGHSFEHSDIGRLRLVTRGIRATDSAVGGTLCRWKGPAASYRQWVLTVPFPLRLRIARDPGELAGC